MPAIYVANRIKETATASGAGNFALDGAVTSFASFASRIPIGSTVAYSAVQGEVYEVGLGTLVSETELSRDTVKDSSSTVGEVNSQDPGTPVKVSFQAGETITVWCGLSADIALLLGDDGALVDKTPIRLTMVLDTIAEMKAEEGFSDGEAVFVRATDVGGLFWFDADDATAPDNVDTFRNDNSGTGLHKRVKVNIQGLFKQLAEIDGTDGQLRVFADAKAGAANAWFGVGAETATDALRISARINQGAETDFISVYSLGTTADRVEVHKPLVLPTVSATTGLEQRSLSWLSSSSRLIYGQASAHHEIPLTSGGYLVGVFATQTTLKAVDAALLFENGARALVLGRATAGDCQPYYVTWTSASSATEDLWSVFRPSTGAAASGNGRWLRAAADPAQTFSAADATPSIKGGHYFITQGSTSITAFDDGYEGQVFVVQRGDANIILTNGANIDAGGTNITLTTTNPRAMFMVRNGVAVTIGSSGADYVPASGGTFTGPVSGPTPAPSADNTLLATTEWVRDQVLAGAAGLSWKEAVRLATTGADGNKNLTGNATIDSVSVNNNDRVLIKNQTAPAENGIYVVNTSGAWSRALDADIFSELVSACVFVSEGTVNADTAWTCTSDAGGTIGVTAVTWVQFGAATTYSAGDGISFSGSVISVDPTEVSLDEFNGPLAISKGGTGQTTAATARAALLPTMGGPNVGKVLTVAAGGTDVEWATAAASTNSFATITPPSGDPVQADTATDTLTLSVPNGGLTISGNAGSDTLTFDLDEDLRVIAALDSTAGLLTKTGANAYARRTITGTANQITVADGSGQAGHPTLSLAADLDLTGLTSVSVRDSTFRIKDNADPTRQLAFELSGIDGNTTRTVTIPNASGTIAYTASPDFTGTPTATTATVDDSSTRIATTAFVLGQAASANPSALGSVAAGSSTRYARADHVHAMPTLSQVGSPTGDVSLNSQKITNLATPTVSTDAATKAYVDALVQGLSWKEAVRTCTTANITLSGTQTINDIAVVAGNRVLVKNQNTASENGIYVVAAGAWSRAADFDLSAEVVSGSAVFVSEGTTGGDAAWVLTTNAPITLGTTSLTFTQMTGGGVGETNTGSNVGTGGVGVYDGKSGVALQFRNINAGSTKVTVFHDTVNKEIDIDVVPAQIDHDALSNYSANRHIDHTAVSISTGTASVTGLSGGGNITSTRTISIDVPSLTAESTIDGNADHVLLYDASATALRKVLTKDLRPTEAIIIALQNETTDAAVGTDVLTFWMPYAFKLTSMRLDCKQNLDSVFTVDVNKNGTSITNTASGGVRISVASGGTTGSTYTFTSGASTVDFAAGDKVSFDFDTVGSGGTKGAKITLIGYRT